MIDVGPFIALWQLGGRAVVGVQQDMWCGHTDAAYRVPPAILREHVRAHHGQLV